jgi:creatinine amidohydrolase/Fe(II)-dependent formamide hydrolase-like protein
MGKCIVVVGSHEQHGPHLPYETDTIIAAAVADSISQRENLEVVDVVDVGVSPEHMDFSGTKTLSEEEFKKRISEIKSKHPCAVFINGHGGNNRALRDLGFEHVNLTTFFKPYDHAGEIETSIIMHLRPELVKHGEIRRHSFSWPKTDGWRMKDYSESGVLGDPTKASPEKGRKYLKELVEHTIVAITQMQ